MVVGYVSQSRQDLHPNLSVLEAVGAGSENVDVRMVRPSSVRDSRVLCHLQLGDRTMHIRAYLASFNITGESQTKLVGKLSGGERNRVHLAKALRHPCNLLLLDEPTNDLGACAAPLFSTVCDLCATNPCRSLSSCTRADVDTLRSLEEAFDTFTGCAVVVSHDRFFLDKICTHVVVFNSKVRLQCARGLLFVRHCSMPRACFVTPAGLRHFFPW